mgnify:CR=1 FL=1
MKFEGKVAIVTGGASGIGLATVKKLLANGAYVVLADVSQKLEEVTRNLGDENHVLGIYTDVSKEDDVQNMINKTIEKFGHLDYMVSNAGIGGSANLLEDVTIEEWQQVIGVNQTGMYLCNKYAIKELLKTGGGAIVNTASMYGLVGSASSYAYSASKGAITQMTRSAALMYADKNIRINAVAPGYVDTPILALAPEEMKKAMAQSLPMKRLGKDTEIADIICFLLSDEASFMTGSVLSCDGGFTAM